MAKIVILSAMHGLKKTELEMITSFANSIAPYLNSSLDEFSTPEKILDFVASKFKETFNSLIVPYKLGTITTYDFLHGYADVQGMLQIFDAIEAEDKEQIIIDAWNSIIEYDPAEAGKLDFLLANCEVNEPVYFISNTNPLNVEYILKLFKEYHPNMEWNEMGDLNNTSPGLIEITLNFYLCLSYKYASFRTNEDNEKMGVENSPPLLDSLISSLIEEGDDKENIEIISPYEKDLKQAMELGIPEGNCKIAEEFFAEDRVLVGTF